MNRHDSFAKDMTVAQRFEPGNYLGQVLWNKLLVAEFSLTVGQSGPPSLCIDPQSLMSPGISHSRTHFELDEGGVARFLTGRTYSVHVARQEANSHRLVFHSQNDAAQSYARN